MATDEAPKSVSAVLREAARAVRQATDGEATLDNEGALVAAEKDVVKTTTFECGCVTHWQVKRLEPTPLTCPVHGAIWAHTESEPR